ncbi:hypothetical protein [Candidatus Poriferisodalis sp.]|uniref:hypothetical protein n=1 Tax=Candidatus Poriferisodalis sp. TaxID=3101277 RepID=UPI003B0126AA
MQFAKASNSVMRGATATATVTHFDMAVEVTRGEMALAKATPFDLTREMTQATQSAAEWAQGGLGRALAKTEAHRYRPAGSLDLSAEFARTACPLRMATKECGRPKQLQATMTPADPSAATRPTPPRGIGTQCSLG